MIIRIRKGAKVYNYERYLETDELDDYYFSCGEEIESYGFDEMLQGYLIDGILWCDMNLDRVKGFVYADDVIEINDKECMDDFKDIV